MRWLVHGSLTAAVGEALAGRGDSVQRPSDVGIAADASPGEVLTAAHAKQLDVMTDDSALVTAAVEQPVRFDRSLVYLQLEGGEVEQDDAVGRLFARYKRLTPGRLYTVTASRVKVRQLRGRRGS